ncbi:hypothetical protein ILYODFUR_021783 [Ilyodon furcidens]|uniref:Uncharacterized protein n=1 Tax=Ilyodon furcidens TaxID=33524 RepID=A0ABV0U7Z9_9TELE
MPGQTGGWCPFPAMTGREAGDTLDGPPVHRSTTQTNIFMPKVRIESQIRPKVTLLDCGRKFPERTTNAEGEHPNFMKSELRPGFKPKTFLLQSNSANNGPTLQPQTNKLDNAKC